MTKVSSWFVYLFNFSIALEVKPVPHRWMTVCGETFIDMFFPAISNGVQLQLPKQRFSMSISRNSYNYSLSNLLNSFVFLFELLMLSVGPLRHIPDVA